MHDEAAPDPIARWRAIAKLDGAGAAAALKDLLADDVVFVSPVVHTPQVGRSKATAYLGAAVAVLNNGTFRYVGEWRGAEASGNPRSAVLEFEAELAGPLGERVAVNGVDMIDWNEQGRIIRFKVMARPLKGIDALRAAMAAALEAAARG